MPNLNFDQHHSTWGTHGIHAFAAKFPPQLARYGIRYYSKRGDLVVDPMMGSGTTLVEARVLGRRAIGYDIDPLARLIAQVKSTPTDTTQFRKTAAEILSAVSADLCELSSPCPSATIQERAQLPEFANRDYWFLPDVATSLALFTYHISNVQSSEDIRDFLWVVFSSLILAKHSVANARDIIHSRHHYLEHTKSPDVIARFSERIKRTSKQMDDYIKQIEKRRYVEVMAENGDARDLPNEPESVDLVVTSPPYATALDYPRAHFLAIAWMQRRFGMSLREYMDNAARYIGSERGKVGSSFLLNEDLKNLSLTTSVLKNLAVESERHANLVQRYFTDMRIVFSETSRILKVGKHAMFVICPSHLRKVDIPTHNVFVEMAREFDLTAKGIHVRTIAANRRILPYVREAFGDRMNTEYVIIFRKH